MHYRVKVKTFFSPDWEDFAQWWSFIGEGLLPTGLSSLVSWFNGNVVLVKVTACIHKILMLSSTFRVFLAKTNYMHDKLPNKKLIN